MINFLDHNTGAVLNGSRLGKEYSANGIIERLANPITKLKHAFKYTIPTTLLGATLTEKQRIELDCGKRVYVENMTDKSGGKFNAYACISVEKGKFEFFRRDPDAEQAQPQPQQPQQSPTPSPTTQTSTPHSTTSELISGGMGLLDLPPQSGDDPEEDAFRRRMQQQHRKKWGRRM